MADLCTSSIGTPSYRFFTVSARIGSASTARPGRRTRSTISARQRARCRADGADAVVDHVQLPGASALGGLRLLLRALLRALLAVQHVGTRDVVLAASASARVRPDPECLRYGTCRRRAGGAPARARRSAVSCSTSSRTRADAAPWPPFTARNALVMAIAIFDGSNDDHAAVATDDLVVGERRGRRERLRAWLLAARSAVRIRLRRKSWRCRWFACAKLLVFEWCGTSSADL